MKRRGSVMFVVALIVVVVLVAAAGGIWWYETHKAGSQKPDAGVASSTSEFSIPEWGVEFQIPTVLNDLVYSISNKQDQAAVATFSIQSLENIAPSCAANAGQGIGSLSRWLYSATDTTAGVHIGTYEYAFIEPTGNCAEPGFLPGGNFTVTTATQLYSQKTNELETAILNTLTSINSQPQGVTTAQPTSTYQNTDYGISFEYPSNWTVKSGNAGEGDYGLYTQYDSGTISLITVEIPPSLYPGTNLKGAYFNLSVDKQLSQSQCAALLPRFGPNNIPDKVMVIDGVAFTRYAEGTVAAGTDEYTENYTGYTNGTCYEFNLGDTTGNDISPTGTKMAGDANDISILEGVLSSVKFTNSAQNSPASAPTTPSAPTAGTPPNNSQSGINTSSWQTESIHFNPSSICWTIKYPPTLSPIGADGGESSDEEFVSSPTLTTPVPGVTLAAVFNETYSSVATTQTFTTDSGLNGSIATNSSGNWRIFVQASEGGNNFVFVLNPYEISGQAPIYDLSTAEAMARSITLSCATPASPN